MASLGLSHQSLTLQLVSGVFEYFYETELAVSRVKSVCNDVQFLNDALRGQLFQIFATSRTLFLKKKKNYT